MIPLIHPQDAPTLFPLPSSTFVTSSKSDCSPDANEISWPQCSSSVPWLSPLGWPRILVCRLMISPFRCSRCLYLSSPSSPRRLRPPFDLSSPSSNQPPVPLSLTCRRLLLVCLPSLLVLSLLPAPWMAPLDLWIPGL